MFRPYLLYNNRAEFAIKKSDPIAALLLLISQEFDAFEQNVVHRIVFQAVKDDLAESRRLYDTHVFQVSELMRHRRLIDVQHARDVRHAHFRDGERRQNAHARRVGENRKEPDEPLEDLAFGHVLFHKRLRAPVQKQRIFHFALLSALTRERFILSF